MGAGDDGVHRGHDLSRDVRYEIVPAQRLSEGHLARWHALQREHVALESPFFRAEYTRAVAATRPDVYVCVMHDDTGVAGFFPYERVAGVARPVGGSMSNFQGVIAAPDTPWELEGIARAAKVQVIRFHHQVPGQPQFDAYTTKTVSSPRVDLGDGWEAFLAERARAGVANFNSLPRKMRKLERELGPVRFVEHVMDDSVLTSLVTWKRAQYERTGAKGSMSHDWAVDAMRLLFAEQGEGFAGMLSALYAGDRLIAAHAGMRSATAWHYWFPAYDPELANYSPGLVLMYEMCKWAASARLHHIDLGPGEGAHKDLFGTSEVPVGIGQLQLPARTGFVSRLMNRLRHA